MCGECGVGYVQPSAPLDLNSAWVCSKCNESIPAKTVSIVCLPSCVIDVQDSSSCSVYKQLYACIPNAEVIHIPPFFSIKPHILSLCSSHSQSYSSSIFSYSFYHRCSGVIKCYTKNLRPWTGHMPSHLKTSWIITRKHCISAIASLWRLNMR